jgi:hypothetical protein
MRLDELINVAAASAPADWRVSRSPTFLYRIVPVRGQQNRAMDLELLEHNVMMTFTKDVSIAMAFGLVIDRNYSGSWAAKFPDKRSASVYLDFLYGGAIVYRDTMVWVDGFRCVLPEPDVTAQPPFQIPEARYKIARLVHQLAGPNTAYEDYARRAALQPTKTDWP